MPSFRFEVDFFSLAYTRALLSHAPCPAPLRHAGTRVHTCAHVWPTHARAVFLPAGRCGLEAALGLVVPSARPAWFPAPRPRLPRRRPPPLPAPWPPLPVAFGSPPSDSQRWAFSEPPVPFPRPAPRAPGRPVGPARASLAHTPSRACRTRLRPPCGVSRRGRTWLFSPDPGSRLVSHPRFGEYSLWSSFFP